VLPKVGLARLEQIIGDPKADPPISPVIPVSKSTCADSTPCRATIPRDAGPTFHGKPGHRSTASRAG
jgi:hypothetical protein